MLHPLEQKIVALRRRVRRMAAVYGLSIVGRDSAGHDGRAGADRLSAAVPGPRPADHRLAGGAGRARRGASTASSARRCSHALARRRSGPARRAAVSPPGRPAAQRRRVPAPAEDDPAAGSAALRRAVIAQAAAETERLDFSDVLDPRPAARAAALLAAACLAGRHPRRARSVGLADRRGPAGQSASATRPGRGRPTWRFAGRWSGSPADRLSRSKWSTPTAPGCRRRSASTIASKGPTAARSRRPSGCVSPTAR